MENRLNPKNIYNARLLYIDEPRECDICDEINDVAVLLTIGEHPTSLNICEKCVQEILNRFNK